MTGTDSAGAREPRGLAGLWLSVLLGPLAWLADLAGNLFYMRTAVATQHRWPLVVMAAVALAATLVGLVLSLRFRLGHRRLLEDGPSESGAAPALAAWGIGFGAFFALLITAMAIPTLVFGARDLP
jgi:hypothetical protein